MPFSTGGEKESIDSSDSKISGVEDMGFSSTNGVGANELFGVTKTTDTDAKVATKRARNKVSNRKQTLSHPPPGASDKQGDGLAGRKIVKAIPPPERSGEDLNDHLNLLTDPDDAETDKDAKRCALPSKSPSAEREAQERLTEKMKKERREVIASASKERKETMLEEKRKAPQSKNRSSSIDSAKDTDETPLPQKRMADIFSVESKFPEHKRTVGTAALPVDNEPVEKKVKVDTAEGDDGRDKVETKSWGLRWIASAASAAAVAVLVALGLAKALRKK